MQDAKAAKKDKNNTLSLLKQVEFVNQSVADESMGIRVSSNERDYEPPSTAEKTRGRFLSDMSEYDDWSNDPFYDVSPYTSDDDKVQDGEDIKKNKKIFSDEDRKFFRELDKENAREAKRLRKELKREKEKVEKAAQEEMSSEIVTESKLSEAEQNTIDRLYEAKTRSKKLRGGGTRREQQRGERLALAINDFSKEQKKREKEYLHKSPEKTEVRFQPDSTLQSYNPVSNSSHTPLFYVLPKPDSGRFAPKMLGGSTSWSPRHSNLDKVAQNLSPFSALNRAPDLNNAVSGNNNNISNSTNDNPLDLSIAVPINSSIEPIDFFNDAAVATARNPSKKSSARTMPLRQMVFEIEGASTLSSRNMREFASLKDDVTTISFGSLPTARTEATKITVLTPEMSQHANIRNYGKLMGRGGSTFQPQDDDNPKRSFFVFKFDDHITSDEKEVEEMEVSKSKWSYLIFRVAKTKPAFVCERANVIPSSLFRLFAMPSWRGAVKHSEGELL